MSSNKACCWILGIIAGGVALTMLMIGWGISRALSGGFGGEFASSSQVQPNTWLILRVSGAVPDYSVDPDLGFFGGSGGSSLHDILRAVEFAKDDPDISGIVLRPIGASGFATLCEMRNALLDFKTSGKPIYSHLDVATDRDYYLASVSDSIYMMPGRLGGINFGGLAFSNTYVKSTFEKIGLKFHVIHAGKYKGAFEDLDRDSMSAEVRENMLTLFTDVYESYVRETADARSGLSYEELDNELRHGTSFIVSGAECVAKGYVDGLVEWPVLRKRLQGESKEFESISAHSYVSTKSLFDKDRKKSEVAVVYAQGEISFEEEDSPWGSEGITASSLTKQLDKLAEDDDVKSVVLRVNSPGGSALASKQILDAAVRLKEKKPLIVSMGRVAASGGYYISAAADRIVAQPNTVTGSIGVVSVIPTAEELYKKIGAREETVSIGRWANFFRFDKTLGAEQELVLRSLMDSVYLEFKEDVISGRGLTLSGLDTIAEGRVWTGTQALARGLVDTLGGVNVAIKSAADKAGLAQDSYSIVYYPKKKDLFEYFAGKLSLQLENFAKLGKTVEELQSPGKIAAFIKNYFDKFEFLQTVLPIQIDA